jgi:hypothetical protein
MMRQLARQAWDHHQRSAAFPYVVQPSMPILFFGDSDAYKNSERRIVTVALNPSRREFPADDPFLRFPAAEHLPKRRSASFYDRYFMALNEYFRTEPYSWFDTFKPLLAGFRSSFDSAFENRTLHTDLCSPLATNPTWDPLPGEARARLEQDGVGLWHRLVEQLAPQVILISVAEAHLSKIQFAPLSDWCIIHRVERSHPYEFRHRLLYVGSRETHLVFGRAAQKPFGTVSNAKNFEIGQLLGERLFGRRPARSLTRRCRPASGAHRDGKTER